MVKTYTTGRIQYIDSLRGIAILAIVLFHAYARWQSIEPFEQHPIMHYLFGYNLFGSLLFITIAGYTITMQLAKHKHFLMYLTSFYLRLAPSMILISLCLFVVSKYIPERPAGIVHVYDLLPSFTLIDPYVLGKLLGIPIKAVQNTYWTLFIIVKLHLLSAAVFFIGDRRLWGVLMIYLLYLTLPHFGMDHPLLTLFYKALQQMGCQYYGWFLIGSFTYQWYKAPQQSTLIPWIAVIALQAMVFQSLFPNFPMVSLLTVLVLFISPICSQRVQQWLGKDVFQFFGFISYPLFLIHENMVTGLAIKLYNSGIALPSFAYPLPFLILAIVLSYLVARIEPHIRYSITSILPKTICGVTILRTPTTKP